ncbi:MAG: hypothetical protein CMF12_13790 [Idiomarina sp.]|uniref:hypothetical protein n=1 Tax=Idiomarina sp. TaxID=1874361 RepID=UPI000C3E4DC9|nr:hypothetical protein [Idiomarina sp.]MBT43577.1 hypothetical protein [Idiomarina sp.]|tara:strand:+ start:628 stop:858 length:231 start_codon:yes stop_codon:yes gene_type:complete
MSNTISKLAEVLDNMSHDELAGHIVRLSMKYGEVNVDMIEQSLLDLAWRKGAPYGSPCQKIIEERDAKKNRPVFIL